MSARPGYSHDKNARNPLYQLLIQICPPCIKCKMRSGRVYYKRDEKNGHRSIIVLAYFLKMTPWGVHKWANERRIPAGRVEELVQIAEGRVTLEQLTPFVFKKAEEPEDE
jgi:hypothetical protein